MEGATRGAHRATAAPAQAAAAHGNDGGAIAPTDARNLLRCASGHRWACLGCSIFAPRCRHCRCDAHSGDDSVRTSASSPCSLLAAFPPPRRVACRPCAHVCRIDARRYLITPITPPEDPDEPPMPTLESTLPPAAYAIIATPLSAMMTCKDCVIDSTLGRLSRLIGSLLAPFMARIAFGIQVYMGLSALVEAEDGLIHVHRISAGACKAQRMNAAHTARSNALKMRPAPAPGTSVRPKANHRHVCPRHGWW